MPYSIDFKAGAAKWNLSNKCSQNSDGLNFKPTATPYANISFYIPNNISASMYLYSGVQLNATSAISVAKLNATVGSTYKKELLSAPVKGAGGKTTTSSETRLDGSFTSSSNLVELKTNGLVSGMRVIAPGLRITYR